MTDMWAAKRDRWRERRVRKKISRNLEAFNKLGRKVGRLEIRIDRRLRRNHEAGERLGRELKHIQKEES